jgi:hypothetical protein
MTRWNRRRNSSNFDGEVMRRTVPSVALVALACLSVELCVSAGCDRRPAIATTQAPADWMTYVDPDGTFRVHYPPNFQSRKAASSTVQGLLVDESHDALAITSKVHDKPVSIAKTFDSIEKRDQERLSKCRRVERSEFTLAGCPAGHLVQLETTKSGDELAMTLLVVMLPGRRAVSIAFSCPARRYDETKSTRDMIERTFEVLANQ